MKVLVTGGAGFIGSHLTKKLLQESCGVTILDDLHTGRRENIPEGASLLEMNLCDAALPGVMEREQFSAVVHLAGQTMVNASVDDPYHDASVNVLGTVNLLEGCRKTGVKRIVFSSTAAAYGDAERLPIDEDCHAGPASFYGLSKLTAERYMRLYHDLFGLEYVALRFSNVYGERQGDGGEGGVISIFAKKIALDEEIVVFGDGGQTRDFIYAGDVAAGIWQALRTSAPNTVYNLSTSTEVTVNQLVGLFAEISGKRIAPRYVPARPGDIYRSVLANEKAANGLSWHPGTSLKDGLAKTFAYFLKQRKSSVKKVEAARA